jgi:hypothetical protein
MENSMEVPKKIELAYYPAILFLRIYPKECKSGYNEDIFTPMLIEALFTITKPWKHPKCPTIDRLRKCGMNMQWDFIQS